MVTTNEAAPPNELKVKKVREGRILDTPDDIQEQVTTNGTENKTESSLFDVLKIIRETKAKKNKILDDKYKRFSMNNFEEIKNSVDPLIDLIPKEKRESKDETLEDINCPTDKKLDKST